MDKLSQAESVGPDSRAFRREVQAIWSRPTAPGLAPTSLQPVRSGSFLDLRVRHTALEPLLFGTELPCIVGHRLSRQGLESGLVYLVSLVDVYTPTPADLNRCLRTRVFYADNLDVGQQATGVSEVPVERLQVHGLGPIPTVNAAPVFPHQDPLTEGDQSDSTSRTVPENTRARQNIGAPITAIDADEKDLLVYTMSGADARYFRIVRTPAS